MGCCVSCVCCPEDDIKRCANVFLHRKVRRTRYFDHGSLIEFENLIDETEHRQPTSFISEFEKHVLEKGQYGLLLTEKIDTEIDKKYIRQEEVLELEEEVAMEARREAARVARIVQSPEIIDPAKLPFTMDYSAQTSTWTSQESNEHSYSRQQTRILDQHVTHSHYFPLNQMGGMFLRDRINTLNSTPPSSIDLEWENEEGLTPPAGLTSTTDDDVCSMAITSTPSNLSRRSTPLSNGNDLEWDGDFTSAQMVDLDTETEQLISEIEQMTSQALKDTGIHR